MSERVELISQRHGPWRGWLCACLWSVGTLVSGCGEPVDAPGGEWRAAKAMEIPRQLVELGEVVSERVVTTHAVTGGEVIWLADEGTEVKRGDVLARFNDEDFDEQVASERREVAALEQTLAKEREALRSKGAEMQLETRKTVLEVKSAELAMEQLLTEATKDQIARSEVALERAEFEHGEAKRVLDRLKRLIGSGVATADEVRDAEEELALRKIDLRKAKSTLHAVKEGPDPRLLAESRLRITQAKKKRDRQVSVEKETIALYESRVEIAKTKLEKVQRQLAHTESELAGCVIRAPVAGRVVFHQVWKGDENQSRVEVGETVNRNSELLKLADLERLQVKFPVNEVDLRRVREHGRVEIALSGIPGEMFAGEILRIGDVAWDKNKRLGDLALMQAGEAGVSVVDVYASLRDPSPGIRIGFSAQVTVQLEPVRAPVAVPATAVSTKRGGAQVRTRDGWRDVALGRGSDAWVEVTRGLAVGEEVRCGAQ